MRSKCSATCYAHGWLTISKFKQGYLNLFAWYGCQFIALQVAMHRVQTDGRNPCEATSAARTKFVFEKTNSSHFVFVFLLYKTHTELFAF